MRPANPEDRPRPRRAPLSLAVALSFYSALSFAAEPRCDDWAAQLMSVEGSVSWRSSEAVDWQSARLHDYFCQGDLLRVERSRAALRLNNETIVRLSEHSQLKLLPQTQSFWVELKRGAAHFLSRTPRDFTVSAPYVNASVDGTEFLVAHQAERDTVTVLEGRVTASNAHGEVSLAQFEQAYAAPGSAPQKRLEIQLRDAVSWTLQYPQLSSLQRGAPDDIARLVAGGEIDAARARLEALPALAESAPLQNLLTSLNLYSGRVAAARAANERALEFDPNSPDALALRTMMILAEGERDQAARQTRELTERFADNASVWLVHSYVLQAQFELEAAYRAAGRALRIAPTDSALWLRRAELALNLDRTRDTHRALTEAERLAPGNLEAELLHGILELKQRHFDRARQRFAAVVEADSGHALGHFMLGLANIRLGQLQAGRERLELAALLDPNNSLYRSYLGKAYFEEHRIPLADTQYDLAKTLDPNDPTPYFYSALQQQYLNRPHLAFEQIELAVAKNDNRALFRSRLQLDADEAARVASQAEIYRDIGLEERAQFLAGQAIAAAPGAHSGHRMMAESLIDNSLADSARASEIFQSQLTQPLSRHPTNPLQNEYGQYAIEGLGPADLGAAEFSSLFERPGFGAAVTVGRGGNETHVTDVHLSAMAKDVAISTSWYEYRNRGFDDTTDVDTESGALYLKYQPAHHSSLSLEIRTRDEQFGDLYDSPLPGSPEPIVIATREDDSLLAAYTYSGSTAQHTLAFTAVDKIINTDATFIRPTDTLGNNIEMDERSRVAQFQSIIRRPQLNAVIGASYKELDSKATQTVTQNGIPAFDPVTIEDQPQDADLYGYLYLFPANSVSVVVGGKQSWYDDRKIFDPKVAVRYDPTPNLALTAAAFSTFKWRMDLEQSLEPTNLLGIIQNIDQNQLVRSDSLAVQINHTYGSRVFTGAQAALRESTVPFEGGADQIWDERDWEAYTLIRGANASFKISVRSVRSERSADVASTTNLPRLRSLYQVPIELRYFLTQGLTAMLSANYHEHTLKSLNNAEEESDQYTTLNLRLEYQKQLTSSVRATIAATVLNAADEKFESRYSNSAFDPTPRQWTVAPERYGLITLSLNY